MADDDADAREEVHEEEAAPEPPSDEIAAAVLERFPECVFVESHGQPVVHAPREQWHDIAAFLRDEQQFTQCVDVTAVDQLVAPRARSRLQSTRSASRWLRTTCRTSGTGASA